MGTIRFYHMPFTVHQPEGRVRFAEARAKEPASQE